MTAVGLDGGRAAAEAAQDKDRRDEGKENGSHIRKPPRTRIAAMKEKRMVRI
jgi:hypothetical protein